MQAQCRRKWKFFHIRRQIAPGMTAGIRGKAEWNLPSFSRSNGTAEAVWHLFLLRGTAIPPAASRVPENSADSLRFIKKINDAMLCIAKMASCRTHSPAAVQLRKLVAAGEIPDTPRTLHRGNSFI